MNDKEFIKLLESQKQGLKYTDFEENEIRKCKNRINSLNLEEKEDANSKTIEEEVKN